LFENGVGFFVPVAAFSGLGFLWGLKPSLSFSSKWAAPGGLALPARPISLDTRPRPRGSGQTHGHSRRGLSMGLLGLLILGSFLYFSTLICCLCSHFGFLQFFENDDVAFVYWVLQNTTFAGGPDHRGSLYINVL
jgi:hypothetical protein